MLLLPSEEHLAICSLPHKRETILRKPCFLRQVIQEGLKQPTCVVGCILAKQNGSVSF